ncbi:hypothetical protein TRFO_23398 [Tritrichomonas foetus]|uniref:Uncharacterized protein n=1 Tax=Tritrichomonas foetus TaxID=1144522 RepID=A0A1J4KB99_9EUKA|nr:hypothetical protein TRFO_23398 [Tritrichomonas foetus]|eukprot:OHT08184.1 hypothetical protein TRFO_23398 [Tritrichomonas foetus]
MSASNSRPSSRSSGNNQPQSPTSQATNATPRLLSKEEAKKIEEIESKYPDVTNADIKVLRQMKKAAIEAFDYDQSQDIQIYIDLSTKDNTAKVISAFQDWLREGILDAIGNYESNKVEVDQEAEDKELHIREDTNTVFEAMKKRHLEEITDVETQRRIAYLREENRESSEVKHLLNQSKKLATNDDVTGAKQFKKRAEAQRDDDREARKYAVDAKYDKLLEQTKQKQRAELDILQARLESLLSEAQTIHDEEIKAQQKKVTVFIHYSLQKAITEGNKQLVKKEQMPQVTTALKKYVRTLLKEQRKEYFIDGE